MDGHTERQRFQAAYRMTRTAFRGVRREGLKLDLQLEADFSPECRRCNAGVEVVKKVAAAIGRADDLAVCAHAQAVRHALGEPREHQRGMPARLNFEAWIAWREWSRGAQQMAVA